MEPSGFEGRGGALVEEARKLMKDDEDDSAPRQQEESGPKIKMGRLGKKAKKAGGNEPSKSGGAKDISGVQNEEAWKSIGDKAHSGGAFTEKDIEFMKKAI
jgi:hypothetical protein